MATILSTDAPPRVIGDRRPARAGRGKATAALTRALSNPEMRPLLLVLAISGLAALISAAIRAV